MQGTVRTNTITTIIIFCKIFKTSCLSILFSHTEPQWEDFKKYLIEINPLRANFTKWSNTLKQFVGKLLRNWRLKG